MLRTIKICNMEKILWQISEKILKNIIFGIKLFIKRSWDFSREIRRCRFLSSYYYDECAKAKKSLEPFWRKNNKEIRNKEITRPLDPGDSFLLSTLHAIIISLSISIHIFFYKQLSCLASAWDFGQKLSNC
jgi:hypothetical protein